MIIIIKCDAGTLLSEYRPMKTCIARPRAKIVGTVLEVGVFWRGHGLRGGVAVPPGQRRRVRRAV